MISRIARWVGLTVPKVDLQPRAWESKVAEAYSEGRGAGYRQGYHEGLRDADRVLRRMMAGKHA